MLCKLISSVKTHVCTLHLISKVHFFLHLFPNTVSEVSECPDRLAFTLNAKACAERFRFSFSTQCLSIVRPILLVKHLQFFNQFVVSAELPDSRPPIDNMQLSPFLAKLRKKSFCESFLTPGFPACNATPLKLFSSTALWLSCVYLPGCSAFNTYF